MIKKNLTLVELVLSIALLSLIILGTATLSYGSLGILNSAQRKATILNEMNLVLDYFSAYVCGAVGDNVVSGNRGVVQRTVSGRPVIDIRLDTNHTPSNYSDDEWVSFEYDSTNHRIIYYPPRANINDFSNGKVLSSRVMNFQFSTAMNILVITNFTLRYNPAESMDVRANPEVWLSRAVTFTSLAHSIN